MRIRKVPTHILIDLENIDISIYSTKTHRLCYVDKLVDDLVSQKNIGDHQVHIFMPMDKKLDHWQIPKRDKLQHFGYNVITAQKSFNGSYEKADMDAVIGTVLGIVCAQPQTQEVWLCTGDGDFVPAIQLIKNQYQHIKIKLGCVQKTTNSLLFKKVDDIYFINLENPGVTENSKEYAT